MHGLEVPVPAVRQDARQPAGRTSTQEYVRRYGEAAASLVPGGRGLRAAGPGSGPGRGSRAVAPAGARRRRPSPARPACTGPDAAGQDRRVRRRARSARDAITGPALVELAHTTSRCPRHGASLSRAFPPPAPADDYDREGSSHDLTMAWDGVARGYIPGRDRSRIPGTLTLHETHADVDPVTFEVIRYALLNTNVEHGQTLQRLCVSPVTMLTRDFQPSILTEYGDLVFLGPYLQYFSNAQALTIKWILENRSAGTPASSPATCSCPTTRTSAPRISRTRSWPRRCSSATSCSAGSPTSCTTPTSAARWWAASASTRRISSPTRRRSRRSSWSRRGRGAARTSSRCSCASRGCRPRCRWTCAPRSRPTGSPWGGSTALVDRYGADAVKAVMNRVHRRRRAAVARTAVADPGRPLEPPAVR